MIIKYFSNDGREFTSQESCQRYENLLESIRSTTIDSVETFGLPMYGDPSKSIKWFVLRDVVDLYHFEVLINGVNVHPHDVVVIAEQFQSPDSKLQFPLIVTNELGNKRTFLGVDKMSKIQRITELNTELEALVTYVQIIEEVENLYGEPEPEVQDVEPESEEPTQEQSDSTVPEE